MWVTPKSIVKEIKKNRKDFAVQLEKIAARQQENAETLQKQIAVLEKLNRETTNRCNDISDELKDIGCAIRDMAALSENQDRALSENIETISAAMQEIMRGLLSLDEANRLIIAKLLLKDMEI